VGRKARGPLVSLQNTSFISNYFAAQLMLTVFWFLIRATYRLQKKNRATYRLANVECSQPKNIVSKEFFFAGVSKEFVM
jgi:ribosomal protein S6